MANIRINALPTTATSTASDDFLGIDGATNGTRKMAARTPVFNSVTGNATTDLTLAGGSSGASLVLGQGTNGGATLTPKGTGVATIAGPTSITDATDASSSTTGSLKTAGGLGVAKKLYVGDLATLSGASFSYNTTLYTVDGTISNYSASNGVYINGNASGFLNLQGDGDQSFTTNIRMMGKNSAQPGVITITASNKVSLIAGTDSSSTTTGSLVLAGGVGIAKKLYVGDNIVGAGSISTSSTTDSSSTTTGALVVSGGVGIAKKLYVGADAKINGLTVGRGAKDDIYSVAIGYNALNTSTAGDGQTAVGILALEKATTGSTNNTGIGLRALCLTTGGGQNTAIGADAGNRNTTGSRNTIVGSNAFLLNQTSDNNVSIGYEAAQLHTTGGNNTIIGAYSSKYLADGTTDWTNSSNGVYLGSYIRGSSNGETNVIVIGHDARSAGSNTTTIGTTSTTAATIYGSLTTSAPTSGTAKPWKLGEVASVSPTSPNRTIRVEIDGTVYYISAKTTND